MPALNFQPRFADLVASGKKRQTIRPRRRRPIKPEDTLYLYTGMRTKRCRRLGVVVCIKIIPLTIIHNHIDFKMPTLTIGIWKEQDELDWLLDQFARKDGFDSWPEMREWFLNVHGLPFEGVLIAW